MRYVNVSHFGWLPILDRMLRPHSDVDIVVHSSWREVYNEAELRDMLPEMGDRIVGVTSPGLERYESILRWLQDHSEYLSFRILDDDESEFPSPPPEELILCEPSEGLTGAAVQAKLKAWLDAH